MPLLSINMVSYNTRDITIQALRSIDRSIRLSWLSPHPETDIELILVDNASTDGTVEAVQKISIELSYEVVILPQHTNLGFGRGHNLAAHSSRAEYLLLLNTDIVVREDALVKLFTFYLTRNPPMTFSTSLTYDRSGYRIHFVGPKLLNQDFTPQPSCGPYYGLGTIFAALFLKGDYWGLTRSSPTKLTRVDWVSGAAIMCKKEFFTTLGGFDEQIFMYMEEIELLHRAEKKGMTTWFYPGARLIHIGSASSDKTYPIIQVYRGFWYLYTKHHNALERHLVQYMLRAKAYIAIGLGKVLRKPTLVDTYVQALEIIS